MSSIGEAIRVLQGAKLFAGVDVEALANVARLARVVRTPARVFFFHEGSRADTLYELRRGRVKLIQATPEGHSMLLRLIGPGEIFGPTAALANRTYPVSAQAAVRSEALAWSGRSIAQLIETSPCIAINTIADLSAHIQELRERYYELATQRVERRVARALLRLIEQLGEGGRVASIDLGLSRQELATLTGTTLFTISRILRQWHRDGLLRIGRQRVTVLRDTALRAIADDLPLR